MRNKNITLIVSGILLGTTPGFAMEKEGEFAESRTPSLPIPIIQMTAQPLQEFPEFIGKPEFTVMKRRPSRTLPNETVLPVGGTRRTSSGSLTIVKKESPRLSPRQSSGFSPPEGKKTSPRTCESSSQISLSSTQEGQNGSQNISAGWIILPVQPDRDPSPLRQRKNSQEGTRRAYFSEKDAKVFEEIKNNLMLRHEKITNFQEINSTVSERQELDSPKL